MTSDDLPDDFATESAVIEYARDHSLNFSRGQKEIAITVGAVRMGRQATRALLAEAVELPGRVAWR